MFKDQMRTSSVMLCFIHLTPLEKVPSMNLELGWQTSSCNFPSPVMIPGPYLAMVRFLDLCQGFEVGALSLLSNCSYPLSNLPRQI